MRIEPNPLPAANSRRTFCPWPLLQIHWFRAPSDLGCPEAVAEGERCGIGGVAVTPQRTQLLHRLSEASWDQAGTEDFGPFAQDGDPLQLRRVSGVGLGGK
jgi:hypothetical protein